MAHHCQPFCRKKESQQNLEMLRTALIQHPRRQPHSGRWLGAFGPLWEFFYAREARGEREVRQVGIIISHEYNQIFEKNQMEFASSSHSTQTESIFLNSPCPGLAFATPSDAWDWKPFAECEDSIKYVAQFLDLEEEAGEIAEVACERPIQEAAGLSAENAGRTGKRSYKADKKKIQKVSNSPFHNYQKHLNNALKKLIIVPQFHAGSESYKQAASEIWSRYLGLEIKTKRILHYIFNESNEHVINEAELHTYGLWEILQAYGALTFNRAKTFLSKLAIDQIDEDNIEGYLKTRKLKRHEGFKEYIIQFRQELSNGYLKRRVNLQQIHY